MFSKLAHLFMYSDASHSVRVMDQHLRCQAGSIVLYDVLLYKFLSLHDQACGGSCFQFP